MSDIVLSERAAYWEQRATHLQDELASTRSRLAPIVKECDRLTKERDFLEQVLDDTCDKLARESFRESFLAKGVQERITRKRARK